MTPHTPKKRSENGPEDTLQGEVNRNPKPGVACGWVWLGLADFS